MIPLIVGIWVGSLLGLCMRRDSWEVTFMVAGFLTVFIWFAGMVTG